MAALEYVYEVPHLAYCEHVCAANHKVIMSSSKSYTQNACNFELDDVTDQEESVINAARAVAAVVAK